MLKTIMHKLTIVNPWHLIWVSIVLSQILASVMSVILKGNIAHDYLITGGVVSLIVASFVVYFLKHIIEPAAVNERLQREIKDHTRTEEAPIKKKASVSGLIEDSAQFALRGSNVTCEISVPDDIPPVEVDEGQITQGLRSLIINADQAMPEGGVIMISAEKVYIGKHKLPPLKGGAYVKISLNDQGTGIPERYLDRIFDLYFTTRKASGLGLAAVYAIVKRHDGHIMVESKVGAGTAFHIYLPASGWKTPEKKDNEERRVPGKGRVLIMDDEEMIREVAGGMLAEAGYEVEYAGDGDEAIDKFRKAKEAGRPFDAVILDLTVPGGKGGKEAVERLRKITPDVRAIVSSGYSNDPVMANFKEYGFMEVIIKPYKFQELSETVRKVIMMGP